MTLITAGLPLASARSIAPGSSSALVHQFAMAAQRRRHKIIASRVQFAAMRAVRPIVADLQIIFGVPAAIGADDRDIGQVQPHRRFDLRHVEAERSVAQHRENRRRLLDHPSTGGHRQRRPDGSGNAVDHAPVVAQHALPPLRELAAVADQHAVRIAIEERLQRPEHLAPDAACPGVLDARSAHSAGRSSKQRPGLRQPGGDRRRARTARDQRLAGRIGIGHAAKRQRPLRPRRSVQHRAVRIDRNEAAIRRRTARRRTSR